MFERIQLAMAKGKMYLLSLFVAVFCFNLCYCQFPGQPNCERELFNNTELQENKHFVEVANALLCEGGNLDVTVSDFTVVCAAQGMTEGLYRAVSIVVTFTVGSNTAIRQYQTWCDDGVWGSTESTVPDPGTLDPSIRTDCYHCRNNSLSPHNCLGECNICMCADTVHRVLYYTAGIISDQFKVV